MKFTHGKVMKTYREEFDYSRKLAGEWSEGARDLGNSSDANAVSYAQLLLSSLILIHGGALVAIPAWWSQLAPREGVASIIRSWLFPSLSAPNDRLIEAIFPFIVGLLLAVVAAGFGFWSMANRSRGNWIKAAEATDRAWSHIYSMRQMDNIATGYSDVQLKTQIEAADARADSRDEEAAPYFKRFECQQKVAIGMAVCSVVSFVAGVGLLVSVVPR